MATTITAPKKPQQEDELFSSFFQQPTGQQQTTTPQAGGTGDYGTSPKPRPTLQRQAAPATTQQAPAAGNFDFSTLVGGGSQMVQQSTATPQQIQQASANNLNRVVQQQYGGDQNAYFAAAQQMNAAPGGVMHAASAENRNTAPPLADQGAAPTRIDHRTYAGPDDLNRTNPGDPVSDRPGFVWDHDGQGWMQLPAGATPPGPAGKAADPRFSWMQSSPYTPGEIGTDDLRFSWEDMLREMGPDYTPTNVSGAGYQSQDVGAEDYATYDFGGWSGLPGYDVGAVGEDTDALIRRIIANPESLDALTVDKMKAASREEQSALAGQADDEMRGLGFEMGISDSPWMAAERLQGRRDRDAAVIAGNRGIEIDAAKTNAGDRRAAGTLAASYVDSKGRLKLAQRQQEFGEQAEGEKNKQASTASKQARAEYLTGVKTGNADRALEAAKLRTQADISNNQNMFNAAKLRQDKVLGTIDADLKRAAATTDRLSLREQASQAAAELGISRDKVMSDWLQALMDDATQRYGIDIAASVDREKLAQAGSEFKEDLAFRIMALDKEMGYKYASLGESGRQFDYGYGLSAAELQQRATEHGDNIYARSQGY